MVLFDVAVVRRGLAGDAMILASKVDATCEVRSNHDAGRRGEAAASADARERAHRRGEPPRLLPLGLFHRESIGNSNAWDSA